MELEKAIDSLIDLAIKEDVGTQDITSHVCVPEHATTSALLVLKQGGVVAGLPFLEAVFQKLNPEMTVTLYVKEGSYNKAGVVLGKVSGPARPLLTGERVALNLIQHTSGVATLTANYVYKLSGLKCLILDTRKTLPGLRALEKYAVRIGGGANHRFGLDDRIIIKLNHLPFVPSGVAGSISTAVNRARSAMPQMPIEVEVSNIAQVEEALQTAAGALMLSRMKPDQIKKCVQLIRKTDKKIYLESLGTINLETVRVYAETGVDGIAIGSLTHSATPLDIVLRLK